MPDFAVIGTGYVGLVSGACFADFGHVVTCVDINAERVERLERGEIPFFEPGLSEVVERNVAARRLRFTTDTALAVREALVVFLAVGTPEGEDGEADLSQISRRRNRSRQSLFDYKVIVTKSTVPIGTGQRLTQVLNATRPAVDFDVVSNPEFLREGAAIQDFMRPDRIVIGTSSERAESHHAGDLPAPVLIETPVIMTDVETAEMIKYTSNAYLAVKISYINEVANLCERVGADVHLAKGHGARRPIGSKFLHPDPATAGHASRKTLARSRRSATGSAPANRSSKPRLPSTSDKKDVVLEKLHRRWDRSSAAISRSWGCRSSPTPATSESHPALYLCRRLVALGARVRAFDPIATPDAMSALGSRRGGSISPSDIVDAVHKTDAVVIMTEWNEFRSLDLAVLGTVMRQRSRRRCAATPSIRRPRVRPASPISARDGAPRSTEGAIA